MPNRGSIFNSISPCSFKNEPLLVTDIRTTGGKKVVIHEYPNRDSRSIEELGRMPEKFVVTAVIHNNSAGGDYFTKLSRLKQVLDSSGPGEFVHFTQNNFQCTATRWDLIETQKELGRATFTIEFERVDANQVQPISASPSEATVSNQAIASRSAMQQGLEQSYAVPVAGSTQTQISSIKQSFGTATDPLAISIDRIRPTAATFDDAKNKVTDAADLFSDVADGFSNITGRITAFRRQVKDLTSKAVILIQTPSNLASEVFATFDAFRNVQPSAAEAFNSWTRFFNFGSDDVPTSASIGLENDPSNSVADTTVDLIMREHNRSVFNDTIRAAALAHAYEDASQIDFETTEAIDNAQKILETQYETIKDSDGLTNDALSSLKDLRDISRNFFNAQRLTTPQITSVSISNMSAAKLSYTLYGSTDFADQLLDLNDTFDVSSISGQSVRVISEDVAGC